jgi:hypothetical protein
MNRNKGPIIWAYTSHLERPICPRQIKLVGTA